MKAATKKYMTVEIDWLGNGELIGRIIDHENGDLEMVATTSTDMPSLLRHLARDLEEMEDHVADHIHITSEVLGNKKVGESSVLTFARRIIEDRVNEDIWKRMNKWTGKN